MPIFRVAVTATCLLVLATVFHPTAAVHGDWSEEVACARNLMRIGSANLSYATTATNYMRLFPQSQFDEQTGELSLIDADRMEANRIAFEKLIRYGHLDRTEVFVCPGSDDEAAPLNKAAERSTFRFRSITNISYSWTNVVVLGIDQDQTPIVVDRRAGRVEPYTNHEGGVNILHKGGAVKFVELPDLAQLRHPSGEHADTPFADLWFYVEWNLPGEER